MATDIIRYDLMVQDALRGVVRKVLNDAAREGMPGEHHFYITFRTDSAGVRLSARMREKYPGEMTIILQHQFWDLAVADDNFEVGLSFNNIPERLLVPFDSITGFFDPSVQFGLKFEVADPGPEQGANDAAPASTPAKAAPAKLPKSGPKAVNATAHAAPAAKTQAGKTGKAVAEAIARAAPASEGAATKVVSIDAFRKKP